MFGMGSAFLDSGFPPVKSIQYVTATFGAGDATKDVDLGSAVVIANSVVMHLGDAIVNTGDIHNTSVDFVDTDTVRFTKNSAGASVATAVVIEFEAGVVLSKEDYEVTIANAASSSTDTITAVVVAKTWLIPRGQVYNNTSQTVGQQRVNTILTNTTTVTCSRNDGTTGQLVIRGTALQFN